jgi:hypothetical protein
MKTGTHYLHTEIIIYKMIVFLYRKEIYLYIIEYIESLYAHIKDMKIVEDDDNVDVSDLNNKYIFLQSAASRYATNSNVYVLNIEQLTRTNWLHTISNSGFKLCDYSRGNIKLLKDKKSYYLPYQYNEKEIMNIEKTNDTIFTGYLSDYRNDILNKIPNVNIMTSTYGKERDTFLFSHKILVNIHYSGSFNIHEQIRTTRCIFNKMIVVSEKSLDDEDNIMKDFMIITERENIPTMVNEVLNNYEAYCSKLFSKPFDMVISKLHDSIEELC